MPPINDPDQARARAVVERLNIRLISAAGGRRQGHDRAEGARLPAALGQPRRRLEVLTEPGRDGRPRPVTPLGYKTATRLLPPVLAGLDRADPRRRAADMIADAAERVSGASGSDLAGGDNSGLPSDGGATTRLKYAARLRLIEALANGWPISGAGRLSRGAPLAVLPVQRLGRDRQQINAMPLLLAVCVEGADMAQILTLHGWSDHGRQRKILTDATLARLDDVAAGLGLGRAARRTGLTANVSLA